MPYYKSYSPPDLIAMSGLCAVYVAYNNEDFDNPLIYHVRPAPATADPEDIEMEYGMVDIRDLGYPDDSTAPEEWVKANMDILYNNINSLVL